MKLEAPSNISLNGNLVSWNEVTGADYYLITDGSSSFLLNEICVVVP